MLSLKSLHKFELKLYALQSIADQAIRDLLTFVLLERSSLPEGIDKEDNGILSEVAAHLSRQNFSDFTNFLVFW